MGKANLKLLAKKYRDSSDWHIHTDLVDGKSSLTSNIEEAIKNKLKLIAITEHIRKNPSYDFDLYIKNLKFKKMLYSKEIKILSGVESKVINIDGELDLTEAMANKCDVVLGAFHTWYNDDANVNDYLLTLKNFLNNPIVDIWAHPLAFLNNYNLSISEEQLDKIIFLIKKSEVIVEFNFKHNKNKLGYYFLNKIQEYNIPYVYGSDSHHYKELLNNF